MEEDEKRGGSRGRDAKPGDRRRREPTRGGQKRERTPYGESMSSPPKQAEDTSFRAPRGLSPSKSHGTRVSFNIVCSKCGREDTLPFVPRTKGEILCHVCAEDVFGENWAHGRQVDYPDEYTFKCDQCGREDHVRFRPREGKKLLCRHCLHGEEQPQTDRLKGMKKID